MSDRTYLQMCVLACPSEQCEALADAISDAIPGGADGLRAERFPMELARDEVSCGFVDEHAKDFAAAAPGAIWEMWAAPKYEWLGSWAGHHPDHGWLNCECAADGSEVLTVSVARRALLGWHEGTEVDADAEALVDVLFGTEPLRGAIRAAGGPVGDAAKPAEGA